MLFSLDRTPKAHQGKSVSGLYYCFTSLIAVAI